MEAKKWYAINEGTWPICVVADTPSEAFAIMATALFQRDDMYVGAVQGHHLEDGSFYLAAYVRNKID